MTQWCQDGQTLCCLCFGCFAREELWRDENGDVWDVCRSCRAAEQEMQRRRERF